MSLVFGFETLPAGVSWYAGNKEQCLEFEIGAVLASRYRIEHVLGEGGMGAVVCATDLESGARVALKFMRADATTLSHARQRFLREIRTVRSLASKHVARVFDAGAFDDGRPYVVMEYLEGKDLAQIQKDRAKIPFDEVSEYIVQACGALGEAHEAGVVHRDLKPANLFVVKGDDGEPFVKVLDFGVSKISRDPDASGGNDSVITNVTDMLGSPGYMAPEQLLSARDADARSDVYSLGVIMYKLVTGQPPIVAKSFHEHVDKIVKGDIPKMSTLQTGIPEGFEAIVMRCLEKRPQARYQHVSQLARALAPFAKQKEPTSLARIELIKRAPPSGILESPPSSRSSERAPLYKWLTILFVLLGVGGAAFGIYYARAKGQARLVAPATASS